MLKLWESKYTSQEIEAKLDLVDALGRAGIHVLLLDADRNLDNCEKHNFYFVVETGILWFLSNDWMLINEEAPGNVRQLSMNLGTESQIFMQTIKPSWEITRMALLVLTPYNEEAKITVSKGDQTLFSTNDMYLNDSGLQIDDFSIHSFDEPYTPMVHIVGATQGFSTLIIQIRVK